MAQTLDELVTFFEADLTGLEAGVRRGGRAVDGFVRDTSEKLRRGGASIRRSGLRLTAAITLPIIAGGAALVKLASQAEETRNKFNVVFSNVGQAARDASDELRQGFFMSQLESEKLLASTGDLLVGFGIAQDQALGLSLQVQRLAADLASFQDLEGGAERASLALTKALLGERESAKELGIVINEALVKEELLTLSREGLTFATVQQSKAVATLRIALRQTVPAQGDLARSSESLANQTRELKAAWTDIGVIWGQTITPIALKVIEAVREVARMMEKMRPEIRESIVSWGLLALAVGPILILLGSVISALGVFVGLGAGIVSGIIAITTGFVGLLPLLVAIAAAATAVFFAFKDLKETGPLLKSIGTFLQRVFKGIVDGFRELVEFMRGDIKVLSTNMGKALIFLTDAARLVLIVWQGVAIGIRGAVALILAALGGLAGGLAAFARFVGQEGFAQTIEIGLAGIDEAVVALIDGMEENVKRIDELLDQRGKPPKFMEEGAKPIFDFFDSLPGIIDNAKQSIRDFFFAVPAVSVPVTGGIPVGMEIPTDLQEIDFTELIAKLQEIRQVVETVTGSMADNFASAFTSILMGTQSFGKGMVAAIQGFVGQMINLLVKFLIERVFMAKVQAVANAIAAAPHPFLIATFVAVALGAFASAMSSVGGSQFDQGPGGGGGEVGAIAAAPAIGPQSDVIRSIDEGVDAEGRPERSITLTLEDGQGRSLMEWTTEQVRNGQGDGVDRLALRSEVT